MPRLRELAVTPGLLPPGPLNAITDVPGVRVGHTTLIMGEGPLLPGEGPVRTGVTAILPHSGNLFEQKVIAAAHTLNGYGKVTGFEQVRELGVIETPIVLTNTLNVGSTVDAVISAMLRDNPEIGITTSTVNPVVGECNDGFLNDIRGGTCALSTCGPALTAPQAARWQRATLARGLARAASASRGE